MICTSTCSGVEAGVMITGETLGATCARVRLVRAINKAIVRSALATKYNAAKMTRSKLAI